MIVTERLCCDPRGTETDEEVALRLGNARREMDALPQFDYVVVNRQGQLDESVAAVRAIVTAERARVEPSVSQI